LLEGAHLHNLKNVKVQFPLGIFTAITGVSGSGKSTLVNDLLTPNLKRKLEGIDLNTKTASIEGNWKQVTQLEFIDQNPIGKSSRSNPVTYVKAYDAIRNLFTDQEIAKSRAYKASHFSFNVDGGRCENCQGEGTIKIEMQFMADIEMTCEVCNGKRFKDDILEVKFENKNIADVLDLTIDEAMTFFEGNKAIINKLKPLQDVGLGYINLGQSSNTLSGGEAQRVKLASFLAKNTASDRILFIFDEPTTGLHFHDISKLLDSLQALVEQGHTVIVIEHNLDLIQCADWIIDLGPEGGYKGGEIVFEGTPTQMIEKGKGHTAEFLKRKYD
jgi:excinuclease ABC subunit A